MRLLSIAFAAIPLVLLAGNAIADDWVAVKLRGVVLGVQGDQWVPLQRGDIVSDERVIRTMENGRVEFQRDGEMISLSSNTQIRILDKVGQRYTTVLQDFGQVSIEAEVQNVQHFSVMTPYLAALVKGTEFTVTATAFDARVDVERGTVQVSDLANDLTVYVQPGQHAETGGKNQPLTIAGRGVLDQVVDSSGRPVAPVFQEDGGFNEVAAGGEPDGNSPGNGKGNGPNVGGNGNGGDNGNGQGNGGNNGGGNPNGNGNGDNGNGQGNGGGDGSNVGGNGNGNSGGNDHGNNGNGNSNGNPGGDGPDVGGNGNGKGGENSKKND